MMPKCAIVMTADEKYLPGVNGQLNAYRYYGMEDDGVEFHLVHNFPDSLGYIEQARKIFPNFVPIKLDDFMIESGRWEKPEKKTRSIMKLCRWWYSADRLANYDAICILDADMQIVQNFTRYFEIVARSDMIALPKNDFSEAEWFSYDEKRAMEANPPLCAGPFIVTGRKAVKFFPLIPEYAQNPTKYYPPYNHRTTTGDMHPVNLILLQTGMIKDLLPLPGTQWIFVNTNHVRLVRREIQQRQYIGIHAKGDLLYVFHGKWWATALCLRHLSGRNSVESLFEINNTQILWKFTRFFNTELYLKIEWKYGDFPCLTSSGKS